MYKKDGDNHYIRYNENYIIVNQPNAVIADSRYLAIVPWNDSIHVQIEEDEGPKWTPTQEELEAAFMDGIFTSEDEDIRYMYENGYNISFGKLIEKSMTDYEIKYYKASDEEFSSYVDSYELEQYTMWYDIHYDYTYVAVVSGNVSCSLYNPGEYEFDQEALCVLISFDRDGELTEVVTDYASDLMKLNVLVDAVEYFGIEWDDLELQN